MLAPALHHTVGSARGFKCQITLRNIAFDFALFADQTLHGPRGNDAQFNDRFRLATFQESEYEIDEFWNYGDQPSFTMEASNSYDHLRCTEVSGDLVLNRDTPCTSVGALNPPQNVSFGFNSRLQRIETNGPFGPTATPVFLSHAILEHPDVPLVWDVEGAEAGRHGDMTPQFSAPSLDSLFLYNNDKKWFPAMRHNGAMNVAFIGGQVLTTRTPLSEPGWQWAFRPH